MKITKGNNNRLGIFLYYDRQGVVDEYVMYLLNSLRPFLKTLLIVVNGEVNEDAQAKLNMVADEVLMKENEGFDVGGYRAGIFHMGLDKLAEYDETILFNYTFFGPLYPFSEMFEKMDDMDLDFWGITRHYKVSPDPYGVNRYGYMPEHLQSHFMALRSEFVKSRDYIDFITNLKNPTSYIESICEYETIFAKHFEDLGYKWDTYVDSSDYEGYNFSPVMFSIKDMIENKRCPIIKRRSFFTDYHDFLLNTCGESSVDAYEYMKENIDYDLDMIWDNLLRLENMTEISKAMHLNYMLPHDAKYISSIDENVCVFIYAENTKHADKYEKYINAVPGSVSLYIAGTKEALSDIENLRTDRYYESISLSENTYHKAYAELYSLKGKYDIMAMLVMSDVEVSQPYSDYDSWQYRDWENLLGTECIVYNIVAAFRENNKLGMLVPPVPHHGVLFEKQAFGYKNRFDEVFAYVNENAPGISCKETEPPQAPFGGSFFVRSVALAPCDENADTDIFLMSYIYMVQKNRYYSGVCYNNYYAAIETTNYDYMMRELNKAVFEKYGPNYHKVVVDNIENDLIIRYPHIVSMREKTKVVIVSVLRKVILEKLYEKARSKYMKMRGWE